MILNKVYSKIFNSLKKMILFLYKIHIKSVNGEKLQISFNGQIHYTVEFIISPFNSKIIVKRNYNIRKNCIFRTGRDSEIIIGENVFFNTNCSINSFKEIQIGDNTIFGENVLIYDHNHNYRDKTKLIKEQGYNIESIYIGKNCWIGSNCVILKGVEIGDNCIIGANNIIFKSIPSNSVVLSKQNQILNEY